MYKMYKKYGALGFKDWLVDAGVMAEGSVDQASEGRHYYRDYTNTHLKHYKVQDCKTLGYFFVQ